ncbi:YegJ family protein [Chryseobacterium sp. RLHN22]|uniref:YegJ family protein n=1 Tax=Chryseobacterium sp. RLHN22 TaxID=3437885 RepID=UPI003D9B879B
MKKLIIVATVSLITLSCENKRERIQREGEPEVLLVESEDAGMNAAIENAKKTFKTNFHPALISKNPDFSNFAIKQRFDTPEGGEDIWIGDIVFDNGKYRGTVQNEPVNPLDVKLGDEVVVNLENLSDWMYYDKNIVKGAYTVKVLRETMSDEEKKEMDSQGLIYG